MAYFYKSTGTMNFPISRAQLKGLQEEERIRKENEDIKLMTLAISNTVVNVAKQGKTSYAHEHWGRMPTTREHVEKLMDGLRQNFPDSEITYTEIPTRHGQLHRYLVIQWE